MLNIISISILNTKVRGPKKVVMNLIKGLEEINYPFCVNKKLDSTSQLWIHDDIKALRKINNLSSNIEVVVGPNLFLNPDNIPNDIDLSRVSYLHPSENVKKIWEAKGYDRSPIKVWPVGVDTKVFAPEYSHKDSIIVYFKNRKENELQLVVDALIKNNLNYEVICYGKYDEEVYKGLLKKTRFMIWLGKSESQGLALEEALSMNVPILVIDEGEEECGVKLTSAPYFSQECGIKIDSMIKFPDALDKMICDWQKMDPRQYIIENLSLAKQAHEFVSLFKNKGKVFDTRGTWINDRLYFRFFVYCKEFIKEYIL